MARRAGIGWAVSTLALGLFVFGIIWAVLYYGALYPMSQNIPTQYPNAFDSVSLTFVDTFIAWFPFAVSLFFILWLWAKSNRTGTSY